MAPRPPSSAKKKKFSWSLTWRMNPGRSILFWRHLFRWFPSRKETDDNCLASRKRRLALPQQEARGSRSITFTATYPHTCLCLIFEVQVRRSDSLDLCASFICGRVRIYILSYHERRRFVIPIDSGHGQGLVLVTASKTSILAWLGPRCTFLPGKYFFTFRQSDGIYRTAKLMFKVV